MLNKSFFLRLSIFLTLSLIQALYTKYVSLAISILGINISIIFWYILFIFSWILLEYRIFSKRISSIEWFHLLFWSFCLATVMLLYSMYINIFMNLPNVKDSLVQSKWITINITYTIEFKIKYFYAYLNYCVQDLNFSPEKNLFIRNIFNKETLQIFLNNAEINISYIQQYVGFLVEISSSCFDNKEKLFHMYDMFFFDTPFATQVFIFVRNILFITFCIFFGLNNTIPKSVANILFIFYRDKWVSIIRAYLLQRNVILEDVDDHFIVQIVELILDTYGPWVFF